eukprot:GHVT01024394.1.p2 GENE.GHVT01024394.1~~GHVT01024394.1.p2  ORF type:complete len:137 (-),score=16.38 GHVT01024394.1:622-1032(-)
MLSPECGWEIFSAPSLGAPPYKIGGAACWPAELVGGQTRSNPLPPLCNGREDSKGVFQDVGRWRAPPARARRLPADEGSPGAPLVRLRGRVREVSAVWLRLEGRPLRFPHFVLPMVGLLPTGPPHAFTAVPSSASR